MKLKLNLFYWDFAKFENGIQAETQGFTDESKVIVGEVVVNIPDDLKMTKKQFDKARHLLRLGEAQKVVLIKRDELTRAEEVVKNMMAIEHDGGDE